MLHRGEVGGEEPRQNKKEFFTGGKKTSATIL